MINTYIADIGSLESTYDKNILTECVSVYTEPKGQYFCATYIYSDKKFENFAIQTGKYRVGQAIRHFMLSEQPELLEQILKENKKSGFFRRTNKFKFFFKYDGKKLKLIDVWSDVNGYIGFYEYNTFFCLPRYIDSNKIICIKKLTKGFIDTHRGYIIKRLSGKVIRL